jgi:hypothetical protein
VPHLRVETVGSAVMNEDEPVKRGWVETVTPLTSIPLENPIFHLTNVRSVIISHNPVTLELSCSIKN